MMIASCTNLVADIEKSIDNMNVSFERKNLTYVTYSNVFFIPKHHIKIIF